jgi:HK97 family phage portal protein
MAFNFFNRKRDNEDQSRETLAADIGEVQTPSDVLLTTLIRGDKISLEQALTIPAVSANLDFISNCIAAMPVKLYKYKQGKVEEVENDSRTRLLNNDTGDTLDGFQFKKALVRDYLMTTGGYAYIEKYRNDVTGLYYVDNEYVVIDYNFQPINKFYKIYVEDGTYQPHEFIKLLRNTKTGAWGVGILEELNDALQAAYQTQLYQLGLVKTGGNKRGFIKSQKRLSEPAIQALKAA